jgi:hypothetical protein
VSTFSETINVRRLGSTSLFSRSVLFWREQKPKSSVFCDVVPCSPLKFIWCFGGTYQLAFNRLHSIIPQKICLFITTVMRTSNPTERRQFSFLCEKVLKMLKVKLYSECYVTNVLRILHNKITEQCGFKFKSLELDFSINEMPFRMNLFSTILLISSVFKLYHICLLHSLQ